MKKELKPILFDRCLDKLLEKTNWLFGPLRRKCVLNSDFTIISNNCWGGKVYRYFDIPYSSPTIGLYFFADDYIKFVKNIKLYIFQELTFIDVKDSKYKEYLIRKGQTSVPLGKLDDIEIVFLHYKTEEEARLKWNRRKSRINWNNLYFKFSEQNLCEEKHLRDFSLLEYPNKVVFVSQNYSLRCQIIFRKFKGLKNVPYDTTRFKYINPINFINGTLNFKR